MMSATMSDDVSVPFTVVKKDNQVVPASDKTNRYIWEISHKNVLTRKELVIEVKNIKLIQTPNEALDLRFEITEGKVSSGTSIMNSSSTSNVWDPHTGQRVLLYHHNCSIKLHFLNYLHEFSKDYKYEILCKTTENDQHRDEYLFCCTLDRLSQDVTSARRLVSLVNRNLMESVEYEKIYFCIRRRYKGRNDMIGSERVHRVMSMLRNSGGDIVLQAKDGDARVHKSILSQNSEVFQTMFSVDMKEKQSGLIDVTDFEKRVVDKMLDYFYTGELGELGDMTESLFKLAHRYQLHELCRRCEEYYTFNVKVDNDNIVEIIKLTELYELENLNECAVNFTKNHEQELTALPKYREYLIQSINLENAVNTLLLAVKYGLKDVKMECFDFVNDKYRDMMEREDFVNLFDSNAPLMKEVHVYMHKKKL